MRIGNQDITREMMPSFVDFNNNPKHLYGLMQDQLNMGLNQQPMPMQQMSAPSNMENKQNSQWGRN